MHQLVGMDDAGARVAPARLVAWSVVALVLMIATAGLVTMVVDGSASLPGASGRTGYAVGDVAAVPLGQIQVVEVGEVDGVTHRALAGATHGVKSYVDGDHATIQTSLRLTNSSSSLLSYRETQFQLRVTRRGKSTLVGVGAGNLPDTVMTPHSDLAGHLDFTILRRAADLALVYTPAGRARPIVIDLGRTAFDSRAPGGHVH